MPGPLETKAMVTLPGWVEQLQQSDKVTSTSSAFERVPLLFRAVRLRCNSLVRVPIHVYRGPVECDWPFDQPLKTLVWKTEASLLLAGAAYWLRLKNDYGFLKGAQWLNPFSVRVTYAGGERRFEQRMGSDRYPRDREFWTDQDLLFWQEFNPTDDLGPGISPTGVALGDAQLLNSLARFAAVFFESGAMPVTIVGLPPGTGDSDRDRVESFFKRLMTGDALLVRGSASNDGVYTITTGGLPGEITVAEPLNDELAGASVTLLGPCAHHVEIGLADVPGSLPAPVRLEFTPADAGAGALTRDLWVGHSTFSDVANMKTLLEGESAPLTDGTRTADPACSAAQYMAHSWSGTNETRLSSIPLDTALLNAAGGNPFLALARLQSATAYTDLWIRLKIEASAGGTVLWAGTPVLLSTTCVLQELGTVQLPPYLVGAGDLQPVVLSLYARRYTAGSHVLALDYIQLLPLEGFRRLVALGSGLTHAQTLVDDGVDGYLYVTEAGSKVQSYIGYGDPILLWPLVNQRLYLAQSSPAGASLLARSLLVRAWYRPRLATM